MEASPFLQPAEPAPPLEKQPKLTVIPGGQVEAVPQSAEQHPHIPFEIFATTLNEANWASMDRAQLEAIRDQLSNYRGQISQDLARLNQDFDEATRLQIWLNGFIRDR